MDIQSTEVGRIKGFLIAMAALLAFQFSTVTNSSTADVQTEKKTAVVAEPKKSAPMAGKKPPKKKSKPPVEASLLPMSAVDHSSATAVGAEELLPGDVRAYLDFYAKIAQREHARHGIPASITLAQALCESSAGLSDIALECNNHFGMKCFAKKHRGCCMKFKDDDNSDGFRRFANAKMSFVAHSELLKTSRYAKCRRQGKNWRRWAEELQRAGYATDRKYAEKLISVVVAHRLWRFDGDGAMTAAQVGI